MYLNGCSGCHGTPGQSQTSPDPLNPAAPQLPLVGTEYSEAQIFWVAKHGIRRTGMFANGIWNFRRGIVDGGRLYQANALAARAREASIRGKAEYAEDMNRCEGVNG